MVGFVPRAYKRNGRNDDSEHDAAADNPRCVEAVVTYVAAPIHVRVALLGHGVNLLGRPKFQVGTPRGRLSFALAPVRQRRTPHRGMVRGG